ncbi:MAG: TetR/AcrR family transcriptional regulator, partial [Acidimicrobiia bacterium]
MRRCGTTSRPRVADIVAEAGLSNETFYRHFPSKDALVVAILEDGTERLASYLAHQMAKESTPEGKIRSWIEGVLSQAVDEDVAAATRAVLWNAASVIGDAVTSGQPAARATLASLLHEPLGALGSDDPGLHAWLIGHAVVGALSDHLLRTTRPSPDEVERIVRFCLDAVAPRRMR